MRRKPLQPLGSLELAVMKVVWDRGDVAVADVLEALRSIRPLHHNTVMTVMNRLARKGLLERYARDGRSHGYRPLLSREAVSEQYIALVTKEFFGGSVARTIAAFLEMKGRSTTGSRNLRKLVEELRKAEEK
jgi:BlaI family transcriptional regulator, penicillinase repressor